MKIDFQNKLVCSLKLILYNSKLQVAYIQQFENQFM